MLNYLRYEAYTFLERIYKKMKNKKNEKQLLPKLSKKAKIILSILIITGIIIFLCAFIYKDSDGGLGEFNYIVLSWFSTHRIPTTNSLMLAITSVASPKIILAISSVGCLIWAYKKREIWRPFLLTLSMLISAIASYLLKIITQNDRPNIFDMVPPLETGFSFPSGHTLVTFIFLLTAGYLLYSRYSGSDKIFWLVVWVNTTVIGTTIIALTRLYLGYHWLTDVMASIGVGLIIFVFIIFLDRRFIKNYKKTTILI